MAVDIIMKVGNILGESDSHGEKQWVAVGSFSHGISQDISPENMKQDRERAGSPRFSFMSVKKKIDIASPDIFKHCIEGKKIPKIEIKVYQSSEANKPLMAYTLENCFIASTNAIGTDDTSEPMENVSFAYSKIKMDCNSLKQSGGNMAKGWDLALDQELA